MSLTVVTKPFLLFQWDSFKSLVKGKPNTKKKGKVKISAVVVERRRRSDTQDSIEIPQPLSRRTDSFTLSDFTSQTLAEQLCLIEQVSTSQTALPVFVSLSV